MVVGKVAKSNRKSITGVLATYPKTKLKQRESGSVQAS